MLAFISFFVSTSEYVIAGILDQIAAWADTTISAAGLSVKAVSWIAAVSVAIAIILAAVSFSRKTSRGVIIESN